ncbi:MAG: oxidoreductase, partial [Mesorhizobium sp.]
MLALAISSDSPNRLKLTRIDEPQLCPDEALVAVHATSLNRGELRLLGIRPDGWIPGQDIVGIV